MERWTEESEKQLQAMQEQKRAFFEKHKVPLIDLVARCVFTLDTESNVEGMIKRAKEFRDLLEPFDDGLRAPSVFDVEEKAGG